MIFDEQVRTIGGLVCGFTVTKNVQFVQWPQVSQAVQVTMVEPTGNVLPLGGVQVSDGGSYTVIIANDFGALISEPARLIVQTTPVQPDDNFVDAVRISGANGIVSGTNTFATKEPGEPDHGGKAGGRSVW